jgi:TusA-related sulfurtransferase
MLESSAIADMIRTFAGFYDSDEMTEKTLNLRGLKCPLPALRTKKALSQAQPGDILEDTRKDKKLLTFRIRKK